MPRVHATRFVVVSAVLVSVVLFGAWHLTFADVPKDQERYTFANLRSFSFLLGVGISATGVIMNAWLSIYNLSWQAKSTVELERVKRVIEKRVPAYGDLFAAASNYYRALATLETGNLDIAEIDKAEAKMRKTEGETLFVNDEFAGHWMEFWQLARFLKEKAMKEDQSTDERRKLWHASSKKLAQNCQAMKTNVRNAIDSCA